VTYSIGISPRASWSRGNDPSLRHRPDSVNWLLSRVTPASSSVPTSSCQELTATSAYLLLPKSPAAAENPKASSSSAREVIPLLSWVHLVAGRGQSVG
jgi:hypothetical protein